MGVDAKTLAAMWVQSLVGEEVVTPRTSLSEFKRLMYSRYQHAAHLALLDEKLELVSRYVETRGKEGIGRLIIAMPPRHGKTLTVSRYYPAWHLGRNPLHRIMGVSYGQGLANKNSRVARNLLKSPKFHELFDTRLAPDSQSVMEWDTALSNGEGGYTAIGIGGGAAGKGANILIIDDPIKNRAEAESLTYRNKLWEAYTDDLTTRLAPGGAIIVMATRWHEDDLTGRIIKHEGELWEVLNLPALAIAGDPLGRAEGEALWADRFDRGHLLTQKATMGNYSFSALYQQNPTAAEGNIFKEKWFKPYVRVMPPIVRRVRYWDLAMSEKTSADYTVGVRLALGQDGEWYIDDVARGQVELHDLPRFIKDVMLADGRDVPQGFEMKGYMTRAVTTLSKDVQLGAYIIKGYDVDRDKLTRALPFAARASLGVIHVVVGAAGMSEKSADEYVSECKAFPAGSHDDQVDASSGAWEMINDSKLVPTKRQARTQRYA